MAEDRSLYTMSLEAGRYALQSEIAALRATVAEQAATIARLEGERDEAVTERDARESGWIEAHEQRCRADSLEARMGEIAELCGPGGDDTPFGRVESMLASLTDRAAQAEAERDALRARVAEAEVVLLRPLMTAEARRLRGDIHAALQGAKTDGDV